MRGQDYLAQMIASFDPKVEPQPAREAMILGAFKAGDVPLYLAKDKWRPVTVSAVVETKARSLTYRVSPWLEIGQPGLLMPMQPATAQTIADAFHAVVPSTKIVLDAFRAADVRIALQTPGPPFVIPGPPYTIAPPASDMQTPQAFGAHDALVRTMLNGRNPGEHLVAGHSKAVVVGPNLPASKLAIYGGWVGNASPGPFVDGFFFQGYPGPHGSAWVDYSQCVFLVDRAATLDSSPVDLSDIFQHPTLSAFVSTQGPFVPRYPNAGLSPGGGKIVDAPPGAGPPVAPPTSGSASSSGLITAIGIFFAGLLAWRLARG